MKAEIDKVLQENDAELGSIYLDRVFPPEQCDFRLGDLYEKGKAPSFIQILDVGREHEHTQDIDLDSLSLSDWFYPNREDMQEASFTVRERPNNQRSPYRAHRTIGWNAQNVDITSYLERATQHLAQDRPFRPRYIRFPLRSSDEVCTFRETRHVVLENEMINIFIADQEQLDFCEELCRNGEFEELRRIKRESEIGIFRRA